MCFDGHFRSKKCKFSFLFSIVIYKTQLFITADYIFWVILGALTDFKTLIFLTQTNKARNNITNN